MGTTDTVQILSLISTPCFYEYSQRLQAFAKVVFLSIPCSFTMWINIPRSFSRKFCKVKSFTFCTAAAAAAKSLQSCLTLWDPIDGSPSRLPRPWDSPGKNTGVGCHFLLQCRKVKSKSEVAQSCPTLSNPMDCSPSGSSVHGIFQVGVLEWGAIAFSSLSVLTSSKQLA